MTTNDLTLSYGLPEASVTIIKRGIMPHIAALMLEETAAEQGKEQS